MELTGQSFSFSTGQRGFAIGPVRLRVLMAAQGRALGWFLGQSWQRAGEGMGGGVLQLGFVAEDVILGCDLAKGF